MGQKMISYFEGKINCPVGSAIGLINLILFIIFLFCFLCDGIKIIYVSYSSISTTVYIIR